MLRLLLQSSELLNKGLSPVLVLLAQPLQASRFGQERPDSLG